MWVRRNRPQFSLTVVAAVAALFLVLLCRFWVRGRLLLLLTPRGLLLLLLLLLFLLVELMLV